MDRGLWTLIARSLRVVPRRRPARARYSNRDVLAVLFWAALHDRSIDWACRRSSWPASAWRRRLPDQSTMSRRLRDTRLLEEINAVIACLQRELPRGRTLIVDGKPLPVSAFTSDPEARLGWGAGRHRHGYKLHAVIDETFRLIAWTIRPMNEAECVVAAEMIASADPAEVAGKMLLADASYDSNRLHTACANAGVRLVAPRRRPDKKPCKNRRHHVARLASIDLFERGGDPQTARVHRTLRPAIERFFGVLATWGGGLWGLPAWARRLRRVTLWTAAKLTLDAARRSAKYAVGA